MALASHYRGGTYQFYPSSDGQTTISTTQTWRDTAAGYNPECTKDHVANQTPSLTTITVRDTPAYILLSLRFEQLNELVCGSRYKHFAVFILVEFVVLGSDQISIISLVSLIKAIITVMAVATK